MTSSNAVGQVYIFVIAVRYAGQPKCHNPDMHGLTSMITCSNAWLVEWIVGVQFDRSGGQRSGADGLEGKTIAQRCRLAELNRR